MAMQLEFAQAMSDFKTMFPDMDRDVIEAVLRANQGAVDATIDQLLAMSTDNQNEKLRNELDANVSPRRSAANHLGESVSSAQSQQQQQPPTAQLIDMTDGVGVGGVGDSSGEAGASSPHSRLTGASPKLRPMMAKTVSMPPQSGGIGNSTPSKQQQQRTNGSKRWNPPLLRPLPANFLRIVPSHSSSHDPAARDFDLPDEQFALMLQNEEFMNQLRWNQEFMSALEKEHTGKEKAEDDAAFKERLKNMGKMSRKKFLQMARVFTWQRNKKVTTAKQIDSLPLKEEPSDDESPAHQQQKHQQQKHQQHHHHYQQQ